MPVEERWATAADGTRLHGLLLRARHPKGLVFYLHGNARALDSWGSNAKPGDQLVVLPNAGHNGMSAPPHYQRKLARRLK